MGRVGKGGVLERGMLHRVWRTGFDGCPRGSLTGPVLLLWLLLRIRWRDMER